MTPETIKAFEAEVARLYDAAQIPHPVHLDSGNEEHLVRYFARYFRPGDYVLGSWRLHAKALLAGVPPEELLTAIKTGHSIALCFPHHRVYGSAIVGGTLPIALGIALGLKRRDAKEQVHCFCGDMTAESGLFHEAKRYAMGHDLPIQFIVEDNGLSVLTDTQAVWGPLGRATGTADRAVAAKAAPVVRYTYAPIFPHAGAGKRIQF